MTLPLRCTSNVYGNIDYGIPILFKQTDYRTTTGTSHRYIAEIPQQFTRTKPKKALPPVNITHDQRVKAYCAETTYNGQFYPKQVAAGAKNSCPKAKSNTKIHYMREVQEKIFDNPPELVAPKISETKAEYYQKESPIEHRSVFPPNPYLVCKLCPPSDSPSLDPDREGYLKWLDPYLTTNRATYIPHTVERRAQFIYPQVGTLAGTTEPLATVQEQPIYDKLIFKNAIKDRIIHVAPKTLSSCKASEYGASYLPQTWSDFYAKILDLETEFPDSLPRSSAWQDLCAPAMYCTEQCHLGTGWPVCAVVDPKTDKHASIRMKPHKQCFVKCCEDQ